MKGIISGKKNLPLFFVFISMVFLSGCITTKSHYSGITVIRKYQKNIPFIYKNNISLEAESASKDEILGFMQGKIAKWWMPDDVAFVEEIPHTATGKILKTELRERFKDYRLPTAAA